MDKGLLKRALQDSEEPTPGYMYRDIVKWTFLDVNTQNKLITAIMERLKPNASVHILTKTLKLVKHLCENGHADFQKEMQRNSDTLKQFANYRGSQDAKYGDKLNERVRNAAREAVDTAFAPRKENKISIDSGHGSNSAGFNDNTSTNASGFKTGERVNNSSSGGAPTGDVRIANMPTGNKWAEHMSRGGGPVKDENDSGFGSQITKAVSSGFGMKSQEKVKSEKEKMTEKLTDMGEYQAIDIAPSFGGGGGGFSDGTSTGGGGGWKFADEANGTGAVPEKKEVRMVTPLQKEVERVAAFKNTPQRVEVTQFCETIAKIVEESDGSQTYEDLAEFMDANISQKHPWQSRLNVLCCIEGIARSKVSEGDFNQYFLENPEDIQRNVHVVQGSLKERATKVMKLLGIAERTAGAGTTTAQTLSLATNQGETTWSAPVAPVAPEPASEGGNTGGGDLDFGGMSETAPRRKKKDAAAGKDKTSLKKRAAITTDDSSTGGGWGDSTGDSAGGWGSTNATTTGGSSGGGWGGGWGDNGNTTTSAGSGGDAWGASAATTAPASAPATTAPVVDPFGNPTAAPPATTQAPPAQKPADDFDALFAPGGNPTLNTTGKPQPVVQPPSVWGGDSAGAPATAPPAQQEPVWGSGAPTSAPPAQSSGTSFDPMSLPAANPTPAPTPAPAPAQQANPQQAAQMQQMMNTLNQQMQQLMANAAGNPNAQQQMQMLMQQQQQLIQMMTQAGAAPGGGAAPAGPSPQQVQAQQQMQKKKADDDFAFAAQAMRQSMNK